MTSRGPRQPVSSLALLIFAVAVAACTYVQPYYNYAAEPDPRKAEYVMGAADVLRVTVWKNPDLSGEAVVRTDGTISLPLIGEVRAGGRTPAQLRDDVTQKLAAFLKDESATVTVAVTAINSYRFVVSGNVERGGTFNSTHYVTVTEAIALAGGPNRFADAERTVLIRSDASKGVRRIPVDYPAILEGTHPDQDLMLVSGDLLYVP